MKKKKKSQYESTNLKIICFSIPLNMYISYVNTYSFVIIVDLLILECYTFRIVKFLNYLTLDAIISSTRFHVCRRDYNALMRLHRYIHIELYTCELLHYHAHYN